jgi:ATP-binding cassette subfamily F protein 3
MAILTASNVSQSFGDYDVFSGVSASIPRDGKVGLVGPNGIGKTTLLLILAGLRAPSTGTVHVARGTGIGYLSQESSDAFIGRDHSVYEEMLTVFAGLRDTEARLRQMEAEMADGDPSEAALEAYSQLQLRFELDGGYEYEQAIKRVLTGLGFPPGAWDQSLSQLSGGQKTRVLLARLLLEKPDLLILDEPTNHLDVDAIQWLEGTLATWPGAVLIVSHDRYFLDRVANTIWEMSQRGVEAYRGNYSAYVQQRQDRWERQLREVETFREHLAKEMEFIKRNIAGQRTQMAQGKLSRLAREVEAVRVGGLGMLAQLNNRSWSQLSAELDLRRPASTVGELEQAIAELPTPTRPPQLNVRLNTAYRSGNIVLRAADLLIGYPGNPLFTVDSLHLERLETAALIGPNGTGKTTFLRTALGDLPPLRGTVELGASLKIGYFAQTQDALRPESTVLDELLRHKNLTIGEARNYLARFLFRGDEVYNRISTLSGGERARLALAILVLDQANFLVLDEPTNHLDIPAQEVLQAALEAFDGTILLVSHDRYLVDRLATQIWELQREADGQSQLVVFPGPYQEMLAARQAVAADVVAPETPNGQNGHGSGNPGVGLSKNELRRRVEALAEVETAVTEVEARLEALTQDLQTAAEQEDFSRVHDLSRDYAKTEERLQVLLAEWEELAHATPHDHRING